MTEEIRADTIVPLLEIAVNDVDPMVRIAALDAVSRFPLAPDAWHDYARANFRVIQSEPPGSDARRAALALAVRIPLMSVRHTLRSMADDASEPDRDVVAAALERVGDPSRIAPLLQQARSDHGESFEWLAAMPLEHAGVVPEDVPPLPPDPAPNASLWRALVMARLGDFASLDAILEGKEPEPPLFGGNPWTPYDAIAIMRPVPGQMCEHLLDVLVRLPGPQESEYRNFEHTRLVQLIAWAATGIADAEGMPLEPKEETGIDLSAVPLSSPSAEQEHQAIAATEQFPRRLFEQEVSPEEIESLFYLPPKRIAALLTQTVAEGDKRALELDPDAPAPILLGNPIIGAIPAYPRTEAWPVADLVRGQIEVERPALDDGQLAWVIARAQPERVINEVTKLLSTHRFPKNRPWILGLLGAAADYYAGRGASPARGAGPGGEGLPIGRGELIDDAPRTAARPPAAERADAAHAWEEADIALGADLGIHEHGEPSLFEAAAAPLSGNQEEPAAKPQRSPDQRRVVLDLYDVTDKNARPKVDDRLLADRSYELELFIAAARKGTVAATRTFSSEELPRGENILSVHFVPLVRAGNGDVLPSQHKPLTLPETADSEACIFRFSVPPMVETYRARFIISYRNRVLQTLILSAPVGNAVGKFLLDVENIVDPSFEKLSGHPQFDAAILVNDSPAGVPGVIAMQGDSAVFSEPAGLDQMTKDLRDFILKKSAYPGATKSYESKAMRELIYALSRKGKNLWDELPQTAHELLKDATRRIQIVDVRSGAYFPAEFVYRGRSPEVGAKLCPNGAKALQCPVGENPAGEMSHEKCEHKDDPDFICPIRMWGFGMVIERQPAMGSPQPGFILRDVTARATEVNADVFDRVVVSVSAKVTAADRNAAKQLVAALGKVSKKVHFAKNWKALKKLVADNSPTLLVLLPHSGVDKEDETIPALELGGEMLSRDRLEQEFVRGPESDHPVLLLLGCDTDMAEIPFLNFIKRFKDCGAAMVMGTITQIDALRTVDFVERFVGAVATANERTPTFGELLPETRRHMLAAGDGYALSLLAYGDTDQRT
ncbi:MAG TPA: hypothetical protein VMV97_09570 [Sulfuriferula sp.]|nr:hypothetical protein [Sulfuriferula sp.]